MSGCTVAIGVANPAIMSGLAASGVAVAGAACYVAARQMRKDFVAALEQYEARLDNERALFASRGTAFLEAQNQAQKMALALNERAIPTSPSSWAICTA